MTAKLHEALAGNEFSEEARFPMAEVQGALHDAFGVGRRLPEYKMVGDGGEDGGVDLGNVLHRKQECETP